MYHPLLTHCPVCNEPLVVTQLRSEHCEITIDGRFEIGGLASLTSEQLEFVEVFIRCEGKINRVEKELGISYPTVRSRLHDIIVSMGYEPVGDSEAEEAQREAQRLRVLEELSTGKISPDEAINILRKQG
ncbi:MAG: DUF2089 domain-containing protein [Chloroflexi bacterium]|nr:DUF2089 domain-containing protein [Chloroflexota bacterium]